MVPISQSQSLLLSCRAHCGAEPAHSNGGDNGVYPVESTCSSRVEETPAGTTLLCPFLTSSAHHCLSQSTGGGEAGKVTCSPGHLEVWGLLVKARGGSHLDRGPELQEVMAIEDQGNVGEAGSLAPGLPNQERVSSVFPHHLSREKGEKARKREAWVLGGGM